MDISTENIILPELPKLKRGKKATTTTTKKKFKCPHCNKEYASKQGLNKHIAKEHAEDDDDDESGSDVSFTECDDNESSFNDDEFDTDAEFKRLRKELESIILNNPNIDLDTKVNTSVLQKINNMSIDELKARIFNAKRELNSHLDSKISDGALNIVNQIVGRMLNCVDELETEVMKDNLLRQSAKELLSMNILSMIPSQIKVAGLYSVDVATAISKKKSKQMVDNVQSTG